ncbi:MULTISPECIES: MFS transporter [Actinosynnema]|uniref:MFS transporter n=1 Tax=Actinosynnema TaxID=40566 RepID=UPI0020A5A0D0|nr:MFS transporter [Actinosynnema pretiosum]MCP2094794.1 MFS transporter, DHA1 family, arabinose polymer transporter [Actinosynnema pretiosum]
MPLSLFALMLCVLCVGTAESSIAGILPEVSGGLGVSVPSAGLLVSGYAATVVLFGPALTVVTRKVRAKRLVLWLMAAFAAGNLLAATAPGYGLLMTGRVVSALAHCTLFAVSIVIAGTLVPPGRQAAAVAKVALGLNLATVLGVPLGTLIGQQWGWRATFWAVLLVSLVATALVAVFVPEPAQVPPASVARELRVLRRPRVLAAVAVTVLASAGAFTAYTFIAPLLLDVSGFEPGWVTGLLLVFGIGSIAGNAIAGKIPDNFLMRAVVVVLGVLTAVLLGISAVAGVKFLVTAAMVLFGVAYFALIPLLQGRIMASVSDGAPTLALALNIAAFNVGIAAGAWIGGLVIDAGLGLRAVMVVGSALSALGLGVALRELLVDRAERTAAIPPGGALVG